MIARSLATDEDSVDTRSASLWWDRLGSRRPETGEHDHEALEQVDVHGDWRWGGKEGNERWVRDVSIRSLRLSGSSFATYTRLHAPVSETRTLGLSLGPETEQMPLQD